MTAIAAERLAKLNGVLSGANTMLIVMQDNPDPDAIATAAALRHIARELHGMTSSIAHGATVGRAENQALLRYLRLATRPVEPLDPVRFDRLAVVDAQPGAGNVRLDAVARLDVVIDHHPIRNASRSARFMDVRQQYGAASTILYEYLKTAGLVIPRPLATALVYGICSDTQDLGRDSTRADVGAFLSLYPLADPRALGRMKAATLPRSYFSLLRRALDNAITHGHRVVSDLGTLDSQEMVAEAADLLLRADGVSWCMCLGIVDGVLHASLRTTGREPHAGAVARKLAGRRGSGGGRRMLAAVQIPLGSDDLNPERQRTFVRRVVQRYLNATGSTDDRPEPLCQEQA